MRYVIHDGQQLFCPESPEEHRLVWNRTRELLRINCRCFLLWDYDLDGAYHAPWYTATTILPFDITGEPLARFVDSAFDHPPPPLLVKCEVALPTTFNNDGLLACRHKGPIEDGLVRVFRETFGKFRYKQVDFLKDMNKLYGRIKWD